MLISSSRTPSLPRASQSQSRSEAARSDQPKDTYDPEFQAYVNKSPIGTVIGLADTIFKEAASTFDLAVAGGMGVVGAFGGATAGYLLSGSLIGVAAGAVVGGAGMGFGIYQAMKD